MFYGYAYWSKNSSSRFFFVNANTVIRFRYVDISLKTQKENVDDKCLIQEIRDKKSKVKYVLYRLIDTFLS